ncbi:adenine phosphoribosyltransferase [Rhodococcus sp. Q]|uniref:adenine phosphoribosyltransferase n=1 Tax=Rhodococcus sp. Q TaxID=2502252 RepID=UPI0010F80752|nr:adenine phosphoribosyltransferase [Rhodococcus sp. Q]
MSTDLPGAAGAVSLASEDVARLIRWADDFPQSGVRFADLTPVFADADAFRDVVDALVAVGRHADLVAGIDARGFLLGAGAARAMGAGVLAVRKAGKLPPPVHSCSYSLEYGTATLEIPADGIDLTGRRVLVIDDVLATGGTLGAAVELLEAAGAEVVSVAVVLELEALGGRGRLPDRPLTSLLTI